jgi:alpha-L-fucosidase 2
MLMQSHQGYIELLPALPREWAKGQIRGLRARGGFEINMSWSDYKITRLKITSHAGTPLRVKVNGKLIEKNTVKGETFRL